MFKHRLFWVLLVLVLFISIALAACAPQNELTPELPTVAVASASPDIPTATVTSASPELPTAAVTSASPTPSESPLPLAAWDLDGDGIASVGDTDLELSGAYEFSDTAVAFDGYTGSASTVAPGPIDTTASFSVSAWVNYADRPSAYSVSVCQLGEVTCAFALGVGETSDWRFAMKKEDRSGPQYTVNANGNPAVLSKSWTHLVGVYDQDAGMLHLYVNGEPQAEAAFTAPIMVNGPLAIGHGQSNSLPDSFWPGAIEEVAVYQAALTAEQVAEIYQTTKPSSPPPPQPAPDPSTYANGILNGTWDYVVSDKAARQLFLSGSGVTADEVRVRLGFDNHQWWQAAVFDGQPFLENGVPEGDGGIFHIEDDRLIMTGADGTALITYTWILDGDQLTLTVVEECGVTPTRLYCHDDRSQMDRIMIMVTEHTYTKSADDGSY